MRNLIKQFIRWTAKRSRWFLRPFKPVLDIALAANHGTISWYDDERQNTFDLIQRVKREKDVLLYDTEAYMIYQLAKRTGKLKGDLAEVGVYQGGSSKLICEAKGKRTAHFFDTFKGLPEVRAEDELFHKGAFTASEREVRKYLRKYKNVKIYRGYFPDTASPIKNKVFSFVHLDVDIYTSTIASLKFFYPRMVPGGIILSHDYIQAKGVRRAFDEFFADKKEIVLEATGLQCMVVKRETEHIKNNKRR